MNKNVTKIEFNSIIIFQWLKERDLKTGTQHAQILKNKYQIDGVQVIEVSSGDDLLSLLDEIIFLMESYTSFSPILDIETHGSPKGLGIYDDLVEWDVLADKLRKINKLRDNSLILLLSCCYGFDYISSISIEKYSPCGYLIAPRKKIYDTVLYEAIAEFFHTMLTDEDIDYAISKLPKEEFSFFRSNIFLLDAITKFLIKSHNEKESGINMIRAKLLKEYNTTNYPDVNPMVLMEAVKKGVDVYKEKGMKEQIEILSKKFLGKTNDEQTDHVIECVNDAINSNKE
ncbi:hypothetical protein AB7107_16390 [Proteus terrae]|uniref:hypothetical protein n=1 Tax=Proteus terrae TaxID=1574161 RepID=UPI0034E587B3